MTDTPRPGPKPTVVVHHPRKSVVALSWRERWWRPWRHTKIVMLPPLVPPDKCVRAPDGTLNMGTEFYEKFCRVMAAQDKAKLL